jgi:hypothetical protein
MLFTIVYSPVIYSWYYVILLVTILHKDSCGEYLASILLSYSYTPLVLFLLLNKFNAIICFVFVSGDHVCFPSLYDVIVLVCRFSARCSHW